jgi:predicted transcriptional regulator of viral defense system
MRPGAVLQAVRIFREQGGILRTTQAIDLGIHPRVLYQMRDTGLVAQLSRGVYRLKSLPALGQPDLVTVALRVPRAVLCLVSALSLHDITTEIPHEVQIALPRGTKSPVLDQPPVRVFRFSGVALTQGIQVIVMGGVKVRVYGPEKTVADCFRFRNKLGLGVAIEALHLCITRRRSQPADLLRYARVCRVEKVMLPYLQARQ